MSENHDPSGSRHALGSRVAGLRSRVRRSHLITIGAVVVVLVAAGVVWVFFGRGSGTQPAGAQTAGGQGANQPAGQRSAGPAPVPTFAPPGRGRHGNPAQPAGLPSNLSIQRNGGTVVLQWKDNSTNENGFTVFVAQGRDSFEVVVPAGTTKYQYKAAGQDVRACFNVVPFTWSNPEVARPTRGWKCTKGNEQ
ncbi:MAG: hypothetical protein J2P15_05100 [Micromonosporaceae bacterium]|nr:hypothetical protein [Micromonosporaceae bacterium]